MRQVFQNLIDNAIKYMGDRPDGRIDVRYQRADGMHRFSVADNGPGIDPEDQRADLLRLPAELLGRRRGRAGQGRGAGLGPERRGQLRGTGVGQSAGRGKGATFCVALSEAVHDRAGRRRPRASRTRRSDGARA